MIEFRHLIGFAPGGLHLEEFNIVQVKNMNISPVQEVNLKSLEKWSPVDLMHVVVNTVEFFTTSYCFTSMLILLSSLLSSLRVNGI